MIFFFSNGCTLLFISDVRGIVNFTISLQTDISLITKKKNNNNNNFKHSLITMGGSRTKESQPGINLPNPG